MEKNFKLFLIKSVVLLCSLLAVAFLFRFPIDLFSLKFLSMNDATRIFSKSDALKVIALAILFFGLYFRDKISKINHDKRNSLLTFIFVLLGFFTISFYYFLRYLANIHDVVSGFYFYLIFVASFISLVMSFSFFAVGIFSWDYINKFYLKLKKPIWVTSFFTVIGYFLLMKFQSLWPYFVYFISRILFSLFQPFYPTYLELREAPLLDVNGFIVSIGAPCSGIESLFLFVAFSIGIFALDNKQIKKWPFLLFFFIGLIGIYFVNVLRLFLLILTGIYISPEFAVGMFHSNAGWLIFVIYFLIYYYLMKKFIYKKNVLIKK